MHVLRRVILVGSTVCLFIFKGFTDCWQRILLGKEQHNQSFTQSRRMTAHIQWSSNCFEYNSVFECFVLTRKTCQLALKMIHRFSENVLAGTIFESFKKFPFEKKFRELLGNGLERHFWEYLKYKPSSKFTLPFPIYIWCT